MLMLRKLTLCLFLFAILALSACGPKGGAEESATGDADSTVMADEDWKDMDEFHMIMAESFHPYKDSANLEPVKSLASEMAAKAAEWASAPIPEKVNNDATKQKLADLKEATAALAALVGTGDDAQIGESLNTVHDTFHAIQESWYGEASHEEGHEEHH